MEDEKDIKRTDCIGSLFLEDILLNVTKCKLDFKMPETLAISLMEWDRI